MGRQDTTLTLDQQRILAGVLGNDYCDNICGQILSEHADRLQLEKIVSKDPDTQKWIETFWQKTKFKDLQTRAHRNTIRDGNFCLMVEYDFLRNRIAIHREKWWDGNIGVFIGYDTYGDMLYACKEWQTPEGRRRTIYYEGAVERWIQQGGAAWLPFLLPSDVQTITGNLQDQTPITPKAAPGMQPNGTEAIAIPRLDGDGNPLKIPFIHFQNPSDEFDNYGASIYDGGLIGAQDQINDTQYDISAAARMTGYQRTWSKGYKLQVMNGKTVRPKTGPGTHYHAEESDADWGILPAGDITQLLNTYRMKVESFCRMSGTPYASITGNWPSGEAVYKLEQPIRGRTIARQNRFAPAWVEVMHRCIELANAIEYADLNEEAMLEAIYADAGDRDPLSIAMAELSFWQACEAAVHSGVPLVTYLRMAGWKEEELIVLNSDIEDQIEKAKSELGDPNVPSPTLRQGNPGGGANRNGSRPAAFSRQTKLSSIK